MKPAIVLSHGLDSGPFATKVTALAQVADTLGFANVRPDYCDLDAARDVRRIGERVARLRENIRASEPVILAGSSMGAFISVLASREVNCVGLFLIALPVAIPGFACQFDAPSVPTMLVHGWHDEVCPVDNAIAFARSRGDETIIVPDDHRLSAHVDVIAEHFARFLKAFS